MVATGTVTAAITSTSSTTAVCSHPQASIQSTAPATTQNPLLYCLILLVAVAFPVAGCRRTAAAPASPVSVVFGSTADQQSDPFALNTADVSGNILTNRTSKAPSAPVRSLSNAKISLPNCAPHRPAHARIFSPAQATAGLASGRSSAPRPTLGSRCVLCRSAMRCASPDASPARRRPPPTRTLRPPLVYQAASPQTPRHTHGRRTVPDLAIAIASTP